MDKIFLCIDLKSFYASVECVERKLNPLTTNLVVADSSRSEKTICLAVSPPLKALGVSGRPRLFEVVQKINEINNERKKANLYKNFTSESCLMEDYKNNRFAKISYITAPPQMAKYIKVSAEIYKVYLKYVAAEDVHVYSIDEVFIDLTPYKNIYKESAFELATRIINDVLAQTGITATAGIGTNMYLAKVAMDIVAKHVEPDKNGVRIASLDEYSFRKELWNHEPLSDFWRIGNGIQNRLNLLGLYTMGDIARLSLQNESVLYKVFGINAELIIDHAWGYEPCTMKEVKSYKSKNHSVAEGQVLPHAYDFETAKTVVKEMAENLAFNLLSKKLVTKQINLGIGYDIGNLKDAMCNFDGDIVFDFYGRKMPKPTHGVFNLFEYTDSAKIIVEAAVLIYERITDKSLFVRRISIVAGNVITMEDFNKQSYQLELFEEIEQSKKSANVKLAKESKRNNIVLEIKDRYGKNSILKGIDLTEGATTKMRNEQIGGHRA